jgi:uncharacterized protein (TIGR03435 family)
MFRAALFAILSASVVYSQQPQQPRFEVVAVRPGGDIFSTRPQRSPGRFTWTTQLNYLIGYAYGLDSSRVFGQGTEAIYTISAVLEPKVSDAELRLMLQSLLAERFNMRFHRMLKEVDGYAVSIGKSGTKMKESVASDQPGPGESGSGALSSPASESYVSATLPSSGVTAITGRGASLSQLTETLGRIVRMPFWDQTGLPGKYDFTFRFSQDLSVDSQTDVPSLSTALRENLGLTIRQERGPLETLVIDHLDPASEN